MKELQGWAAAAASTTTTSVGNSCFKSICVFCESTSENGTVYQAARELGAELVQRKAGLVFGGGSIGLMVEIAGTVHTGGGKVTGVIAGVPRGHETIGELMPTDDDKHQCKVMAGVADAFIALPGMWILNFGGINGDYQIVKTVGLVNVNGYYDPLLMLFDKALKEGLLNDAARRTLVSAPTPKELIDKMVKLASVRDKNMRKPTCLGELFEIPITSNPGAKSSWKQQLGDVMMRPSFVKDFVKL